MRRTRRAWGLAAARALAAACLLVAGQAAAAEGRALEMAVKAAFLTKFGAFVNWPAPGPLGGLNVCVVGDDPFGAALEQAAHGQANVRVARLAEVNRDSGCQVLYAAGSARQSVAQSLQAVRGTPVLTVTDAGRGPVRGMIHFVVFEDRVRFHIDTAQAAQGGLSISSKLLALGLSVKR